MKDSEAEMEIFGLTHDEVGTEIARLWKLPVELTKIISCHSDPRTAGEYKELVAIVRLADELCEIWGAGFYEGIKTLNIEDGSSWNILCESYPELKELDVEIFTFELEEEFKKSSTFLNIIIGDAN